jgi:hypothetical protein
MAIDAAPCGLTRRLDRFRAIAAGVLKGPANISDYR